MLKERVVSGVIGVLFLLIILLCPAWVMAALIVLCSGLGLLEFYAAAGMRSEWQFWALSLALSAACVAAPYIAPEFLNFALFLYLFAMFFCCLLLHQKVHFEQMAMGFFGGIYVSFLMAHILFTRMLPDGKWLVYFVFAGAFLCDTFAYFVGRFLGHKKLAPEISPKKTVAGAIGGILGTVLCMMLLAFILSLVSRLTFRYILVALLGLLCGIMAELGDLFASLIKRRFQIKDFGNIMPGHGGVLDRFDSLLFVAPTVYYFVSYLNIIK